MSDNLIEPGPKVLAQITLSLVEGVGLNIQIPVWADELIMRGLLDKVRTVLDEHFRQAALPRVVPGNGMPHAIAKHLRG